MQQANDMFSSRVLDTTPRQLAVLIALDENEGISQQALSNRTGIDRSTLGQIVQRLTRRGLVGRSRSARDCRAYVVKLTNEGQHLLRQTEPLAAIIDQRVLSALPEGRRELFLTLLAAMPSKLSENGRSIAKLPRAK
jgi:DNA-binding MarR family transcriptional regulator